MAETRTVVLETERLVLRHFTPDDLDALVALTADPAVMRYLNGGRPLTRDEVSGEVLPRFLRLHATMPQHGYFAAEERTTGRFIGWFCLRPASEGGDPAEPELGYRLRRDAWGCGYATEGARALVDHAFATLGARRVWGTAMTVHTASRRVMEKAGLQFVRRFHGEWPEPVPGDEHGDVEYALARAEWDAAKPPPRPSDA